MDKMNVSIGDIRIDKETRSVVDKILQSGRISEGIFVKQFEDKFANYIGTKYSTITNSGTSALIASLTALYHSDRENIKRNSNSITTPLTYVATSNAIIHSGYNPVYVDVDKDTFLISPEKIKCHLEEVDDINDYSLILPVHLMGYVCDMKKINKIGEKKGLDVFEDSSQAHGSIYNKKKAGSLSSLGTFSFYIAHNIQAGEMGAITTDSLELNKLTKKIKSHGRLCDCPICTRSQGICPYFNKLENDYDPRFTHDLIGYNFKTTEIQAAIALGQLNNVELNLKKRRKNVKYLNEGLEGLSDIIKLPSYSDNVSYLAYPLVIKKPKITSRKKIRFKLEKKGIETRPLFGCIPTQQPAYQYLKNEYKHKLPNAEYLGLNAFYIGCHQYLERDQLDYVIDSLKCIIQ